MEQEASRAGRIALKLGEGKFGAIMLMLKARLFPFDQSRGRFRFALLTMTRSYKGKGN